MHNNLAVALVAGLGGMLGWGTADFFAKKTIDKIGDLSTLFWQQTLGVLPLLIAFLVHPKVPMLGHAQPFYLLAFGVVSGLSYLPLYSGFGKGQVSLLSPIFASYSVMVVILSVILLGEALNLRQVVAIAITFVGILLISTDINELRTSFRRHTFKMAGLSEVMTAMLAYSFWLLYLDKFLDGKPWLFYLLIIRLIASLTLLAYAGVKRTNLIVIDRSLWKYLALIGGFDVGAFSFISYGFSHSHYPSLIAVLSATFSVPTIILANLFLKEKINRSQLIAVATILVGVVLISIT